MDPIERNQIIATSIIVAAMFTLLFYGMYSTTQEESPKFQVVDKYGNCDVIRYTDTTQRWNYLLKCP